MRELIERLGRINIENEIGSLKDSIEKESNPRKIDKLVRKYKILSNLKDENLNPVDAFTQTKLLVPPSSFRAPMELPDGNVVIPDVNLLIRDVGFARDTLEKAKREKLPESVVSDLEYNLYKMTEELGGFDPPKHDKKVTHNIFTYLAGIGSPKGGFVQRHLLRKRQDLTGRGVIAPDPTIDIDEVKLPYDIGFGIYEPFIKKELINRGYKSKEADELIEKKDPRAKDALREVGRERPVFINRAPSIRQTSVNTLWPIFTEDKQVGVPNLLAGLNPQLDFDGDSSLCWLGLGRFPHIDFTNFLDRFRLWISMTLKIIKARSNCNLPRGLPRGF